MTALLGLALALWARMMFSTGTAVFALASKFSAQLLLPIFLLLYLIRWWQKKAGFSVNHLVRSCAILCLVAFVVIYACYGFETRALVSVKRSIGGVASVTEKASAAPFSPLISRLAAYPRLTSALDFVASSVPIPAISYLIGTVSVFFRPHTAYLLGKLSATGWWYYFPIVFGVKTPAPTLLLLVLAIVIALKEKRKHSLRDISFRWFVIVIPPAFYFLVSMASKINLGVRHILPIYPFLFIFIAAVLFHYAQKLRPITVVLTALLIIGSIRTYPGYLAFFNAFAGGTSSGPKYLLDSNLDWGQDTKRLARYLAERGLPPACLHGFEDIVLDYYGVKRTCLPSIASLDEAQKVNCLVIVNAGQLYMNRDFGWLKTQKSDDRIGCTLYVYDFRRKPASSKVNQ